MQKIIKYIICILLLLITSIFSSVLTKEQVIKEEHKKNHQYISSIFGNIVYAFSSNKENDLLKVASNVIYIEMINLNTNTQVDLVEYKNLCPMLNESFKRLIATQVSLGVEGNRDKNVSKNFKQQQIDFNKGYEKLLHICDKL